MQLCDLVHKLAHYCHAIHNQSTGIVQCLHVAHFFKNERASEREFKFRFVATVRRKLTETRTSMETPRSLRLSARRNREKKVRVLALPASPFPPLSFSDSVLFFFFPHIRIRVASVSVVVMVVLRVCACSIYRRAGVLHLQLMIHVLSTYISHYTFGCIGAYWKEGRAQHPGRRLDSKIAPRLIKQLWNHVAARYCRTN